MILRDPQQNAAPGNPAVNIPMPQGQVAEQTELHHKLAVMLAEKLTTLESRLDPYLTPIPPNDNTIGDQRPSLVRFAEYVRTANDNVAGSISRLDSILERLQI